MQQSFVSVQQALPHVCRESFRSWLPLAPLLAGTYNHLLDTSVLMLSKHTCLPGLRALCRPSLSGIAPLY